MAVTTQNPSQNHPAEDGPQDTDPPTPIPAGSGLDLGMNILCFQVGPELMKLGELSSREERPVPRKEVASAHQEMSQKRTQEGNSPGRNWRQERARSMAGGFDFCTSCGMSGSLAVK